MVQNLPDEFRVRSQVTRHLFRLLYVFVQVFFSTWRQNIRQVLGKQHWPQLGKVCRQEMHLKMSYAVVIESSLQLRIANTVSLLDPL